VPKFKKNKHRDSVTAILNPSKHSGAFFTKSNTIGTPRGAKKGGFQKLAGSILENGKRVTGKVITQAIEDEINGMCNYDKVNFEELPIGTETCETGVQTEESWDYLDRLEMQIKGYENRFLDLNKCHNSFINDFAANASDLQAQNQDLRNQLCEKNEELLRLEQKKYDTERDLNSKMRKKNDLLEIKQEILIKQLKELKQSTENESKLKTQIKNLESSLSLQRDFSQRLSVSAIREKSTMGCLSCFNNSPQKPKSPRPDLSPQPSQGTNSRKSIKGQTYDNNPSLIILLKDLETQLETSKEKLRVLENEKRLWVNYNSNNINNKSKNNQNFYFYNIENINNENIDSTNTYTNTNTNSQIPKKFTTKGPAPIDLKSIEKNDIKDLSKPRGRPLETYKENLDSD
jgi:hypothetical protein